MRISTLVRYGTRALMQIAEGHPGNVVSVKEIARSQEISGKYLERILSGLKAAGLVRAVRGVNGGYLLTRAPRKVRLDEVFAALGGSPVIVECIRRPEYCTRSATCRTRLVWKRIQTVVEGVLKATTLGHLVEKPSARGRAWCP